MDRREEIRRDIGESIAHGIATGIGKGIAIFIGFVIFIALGSVVVQWLWNWLVPSIFGLRELTLWEALGVLTLSRILFGGFGGGGGSSAAPRRHRREWWKKVDSEISEAGEAPPPTR